MSAHSSTTPPVVHLARREARSRDEVQLLAEEQQQPAGCAHRTAHLAHTLPAHANRVWAAASPAAMLLLYCDALQWVSTLPYRGHESGRNWATIARFTTVKVRRRAI
ncbi:hypothetical protein SKAU_G00103890 [Synaphobranchus kaupii]|uniref:Uncharacterized protein n=1 Tax=Synaphobranchus kaupii TaxID=118154 RepID=A0A9Q1FZ47_SYNKA|nr:hypothetical protein SKAU_G00103890 [Synaphobranchus kaupii]